MIVDRLAERWPRDDLEYARLLASTLLVLLLVPLVITHLIVHPLETSERMLGSALPK